MGNRQLRARNSKLPANAAGANDDLIGLQAETAFRLDGMRISKTGRACIFMNSDAGRVDLAAKSRVFTGVVDDLPDTRK